MKLAGQFAAAAIPVLVRGARGERDAPFVEPLDLGDWGYPLTLLGIVAVMNVVNFTDGADGLAAGVCTIAAATFAIIALSLDRVDAGILAALTAGAAVGFLWHNFHPASIFMGDAGSNLLGLLLACVAIQGVLKTAAVVALFFPLLILAVPASTRPSWWPSGSSTAGPSTPPTAGTSTTASRTSASRSAGPCSTSTAGRCRSRRWRWRCGSCPTRRTTARSTPAGRS